LLLLGPICTAGRAARSLVTIPNELPRLLI
jgi:hypothetical protein